VESNALFASEPVNVEMSGVAHLHVLMSKTANPQNSGAFLETMENHGKPTFGYSNLHSNLDGCNA
jgi:hypothetical protein